MKLCQLRAGPISLIFLLFLFVSFSPAQAVKPNFNRVRTYDVQHYLIKTRFDRGAKRVFGETTVSLKPLKDGLGALELDAAGMTFDFVRLEPAGADLKYTVKNEKIAVTLDRAYGPAENISITFKYTAKPEKGVYFVEAERNGAATRAAQIWTQGEAEESHHWFPSYDFPDDKATSEQILTVEKDETAIANGELIETKANPDGTKTFHYKMPVPHAVYLTSFIVGTYVKVSDSYKNVPLGIYLYPGRESFAQKAFGSTKEMMRIFEELTGVDYPYNKYDQTIVAKFNLGGMENITATTFADEQIFFADFDFGRRPVEDLVSHELSHSWFGNLVTCRNWAELWLNESFATFMEAAYREKMYGREDYLAKIRSDVAEYFAAEVRIRKKHGLYNLLARPDDSIFDEINYQKGGAVVHTLRETVGDEVFWRAINVYLNRHKFGSVETVDLQKVFEETSKKDLDWFFAQWVYGTGYPKLEVKTNYNRRTRTLTLDVRQTQKIEDLTPAAFVLPIEVDIQTPAGTRREKINLRKRAEVFTFKMNDAPLKIDIDANEKIPLKTVKITP
jgi:aminopeptidase N